MKRETKGKKEKKKTTMNLRFHFLAAGIVILASANLWAGGIKVIANPSVRASSISADDIKNVFLENTSSLGDGTHVEPVLAKGGPAHVVFVKQYLGKTDTALQVYYRSLVFTGRGSMPKTVGSDAEVVDYVAKTKGAIGYVSAETSTHAVKTLEIN